MNVEAIPRTRLEQWLAQRWFMALWCVVAAFGTYAAMYGFRKPFTAGSYIDADSGSQFKGLFVTAQVIGYTVSKFIGIKIVSEMNREQRMRKLMAFIAWAEGALILFAIVPSEYKAICMFLNGLPLGMVLGFVMSFLEGRRLTEFFVAGLCASFIVADGLTKTVGSRLLLAGVDEYWMPSLAGAIFFLPLLFFTWMLMVIPIPTTDDVIERSERSPMTNADRLQMLRRYGIGLPLVVIGYVLITIMRSVRADFAPEIWRGMGFQGQPILYTYTELWVALGVIVLSSLLVFVRDNRRALTTAMLGSIIALATAAIAVVTFQNGSTSPFVFTVLLGLGMYVPYVVVHTTIFDRLIAITRDRGNLGFLMYTADAVGYLGYAGVMLGRSFIPRDERFLEFFLAGGFWLSLTAGLFFLVATLAFNRLEGPSALSRR